ncbi:hypothetical protein VTK26DRAFT_1261 [Humicola hyalothermophila]
MGLPSSRFLTHVFSFFWYMGVSQARYHGISRRLCSRSRFPFFVSFITFGLVLCHGKMEAMGLGSATANEAFWVLRCSLSLLIFPCLRHRLAVHACCAYRLWHSRWACDPRTRYLWNSGVGTGGHLEGCRFPTEWFACLFGFDVLLLVSLLASPVHIWMDGIGTLRVRRYVCFQRVTYIPIRVYAPGFFLPLGFV